MSLKQILFFILLMVGFQASATHNRAGEITYEHLFGNTYRFTITTCTKINSPADRPELEINYGDGEKDTVARVDQQDITSDVRKNIYIIEHTYAGPGTYTISVLDPNRNANVLNIANSVNTAFCIRSQLVISPFVGYNNSSILEDCPCPEVACVNKPYYYNALSVDPDGDSLAYELVPCLGNDCEELLMSLNYVYIGTPLTGTVPTGGGGYASIDPISGTIEWITPQLIGEYNIAVLIKEYRAGIFVGSVLRDIQITVSNCDNNPPEIELPNDTCIIAGETLSFDVVATDVDNDMIDLEGHGSPFNVSLSPAILTSNTSVSGYHDAQFTWQTNCSHIRTNPYQIFFTAEDNDISTPLMNIKSMFVTILPPPPSGVSVSPAGGKLNVTWTPSVCNNATGYNIYRKIANDTVDDPCCESGSIQAAGYELIGSVDGNTFSFYDQDDLSFGFEYCYIVTTLFQGNVESCPSDPSCSMLLKDFPVITHVSVISTDVVAGQDSVIWSLPTELDTAVQYPGPYFYQIYRGTNSTTNLSDLVYSSPDYASFYQIDTNYLDQSINTEENYYSYRIDLYNYDGGGNQQFIASSNVASSVFLEINANDNRLFLNWSETVPWLNYEYDVFKETAPGTGVFNYIATTTDNNYIDTGLINGQEYCYKVKSRGEYMSTSVINPLLNWSQRTCGIPVDLTAPCAPELYVLDDCDLIVNELSWTNPNNSCADDVIEYRLYYAPTDDSEFYVLTTFTNDQDTSFLHDMDSTIAGCYYVTALDSINTLGFQNESDSSNVICIDNCPEYWLPNVFTPNEDGLNDKFIPFPYKFVSSIQLRIYNRWGGLVFETTDPDILWDGTNMDSGEPVSEGVYYYICEVNTIRLSGIEPVVLKGNIQLIRGNSGANN